MNVKRITDGPKAIKVHVTRVETAKRDDVKMTLDLGDISIELVSFDRKFRPTGLPIDVTIGCWQETQKNSGENGVVINTDAEVTTQTHRIRINLTQAQFDDLEQRIGDATANEQLADKYAGVLVGQNMSREEALEAAQKAYPSA